MLVCFHNTIWKIWTKANTIPHVKLLGVSHTVGTLHLKPRPVLHPANTSCSCDLIKTGAGRAHVVEEWHFYNIHSPKTVIETHGKGGSRAAQVHGSLRVKWNCHVTPLEVKGLWEHFFKYCEHSNIIALFLIFLSNVRICAVFFALPLANGFQTISESRLAKINYFRELGKYSSPTK